MSENPYEILCVDVDSSQSDIKKAYRKLALKYHPDRQKEEDRETANAMFAKIANAYQILSDEKSRRQFDLRKKVGSSPDISFSNGSSPTTRQTTTQTWSHSSPTKSTTKRSTTRGKSPASPSNITFSFSSSDFDASHDDPFEMFKKVYREQYGREFDPNEAPPISPIKKKVTNVVRSANSPTKTTSYVGVAPVSHGSKKASSPRKTIVSTVLQNSPLSRQRSKTKNKAGTTAFPVESAVGPSKKKDGQVVSMSSKTSTSILPDGTQQIVKETKKTMADGSVATSREIKIVRATS